MTAAQEMDFDVVIVGGGAIGATLALSLARLDYRVALIERYPLSFSSTSPERVIALNHGSRAHLEQLGVWQDIASAGTGEIRHIHVAEPGNRGQVDMHALESPQYSTALDALGYVVEMGPMLAPIYQQLESSSVELLCPALVHTLDVDEDHVSVGLSSGDAQRTIQAALLVGADGTNSQIRGMAGISTQGWDYNRFGIVASIRCEQDHSETAYECFRNSGPLAFLPLADGRFSIVWALTPGEANQVLEMDDDAFISALMSAAGDDVLNSTGPVLETSARAAFPLELNIASNFAGPRLALVGNAAHTVHPVGGQGMNLGLRDVEVLVEALDSEIGHRDPGQSILMQAYAEQRRKDVLAVAGFTESMVSGFGCRLPGFKWLRGRGLDMMEQWPALKGLLLSHAAGLSQTRHQVSSQMAAQASKATATGGQL